MDEASARDSALTPSSLSRLVVFSVVTLGSGWIGLLVDNALGIPHSMEALGTLIWIMTPILTGAVLALSVGGAGRSAAGVSHEVFPYLSP